MGGVWSCRCEFLAGVALLASLCLVPLVAEGADYKPIARAELEDVRASISGRTILVDWQGSWDYTSIQESLDNAEDGDTIIVLPSDGSPDGAYVETLIFPQTVVTLRSVYPDDPEIVARTIITGERRDSVVRFPSLTSDLAVLDGFTINGGVSENGGGIMCSYCSPTIRNCVLYGNTGFARGGGMHLVSSHSLISNCTFSTNFADSGGGLSAASSSVTIRGCRFVDNLSTAEG